MHNNLVNHSGCSYLPNIFVAWQASGHQDMAKNCRLHELNSVSRHNALSLQKLEVDHGRDQEEDEVGNLSLSLSLFPTGRDRCSTSSTDQNSDTLSSTSRASICCQEENFINLELSISPCGSRLQPAFNSAWCFLYYSLPFPRKIETMLDVRLLIFSSCNTKSCAERLTICRQNQWHFWLLTYARAWKQSTNKGMLYSRA